MPLPVACNNTEMVTIILTPKTAAVPNFPGGRPAPLDGPLRISVQSGDGTFLYDENLPLQFKCVSGELLADTVYLVEGDADMGAGPDNTELLQDTVTLTVTGARARFLGLQAGPVEPKPEAVAPAA